jgi:hypothetical protein
MRYKIVQQEICCHSIVSRDGDEDEDDEGISERSLRRTPSDDGKNRDREKEKERETI